MFVSAAMIRESLDVLRDLNSYVERAQRILTEYLLPESGVAPEAAISGVLEQWTTGSV